METLWLGAVAYDPKAVTIWESIREVFRAAKLPFEFALLSSYEALVEALLGNRVEVAWATPTAYLQIQRRTGGRALALGMRDVDVGMRSQLVVRRGSPLESISSLRRRRIAFGSRDSAQAAILPLHWLEAQEGLVPGRDFEALRFDLDVGKHGDTGTSELAVLRAIANGEADAGALCDATWVRAVAEGLPDAMACQPIWTSPPFNHCMFTALPSMVESRARLFTETLLAMDFNRPEHRRAMELEGLRRWMPPNRDGYGDLERAMERQGFFPA